MLYNIYIVSCPAADVAAAVVTLVADAAAVVADLLLYGLSSKHTQDVIRCNI